MVKCIYNTKRNANRGGDNVSVEEKKILQSLAENLDVVPEEKREYLLGIGEGLRLAKEKAKESTKED